MSVGHRLGRAERGVSAVLVALLLLPMVGFVALAVDVSVLNNERQRLWDTVDAAALAGASLLPDAASARSAALANVAANMPGLAPTIDFRCVVGATSAGQPNATHMPSTCNPGPGPYTIANYAGMACSAVICSLPCNPEPPQRDTCNTMVVTAQLDVPYVFAPVIGFEQGGTGVLQTAACRGSCGKPLSGPADIVLVLDRTGSMRPVDIQAVKDASLALLEGLDPSAHHVALATLGRTSLAATAACPTIAGPSRTDGLWLPIGLHDDYDLTDSSPPSLPPDLNPASSLVVGIECIDQSSTGTNLGDPIATAGSYLLNNGRPNVTKAIIFMTDGEANEASVGLPCDHAMTQAQIAEDAGIIVVTVAYRLQGVQCGPQPATTVLATMASNRSVGPPTMDDGGDGPGGHAGGCPGNPLIGNENIDGDLFFCASDSTDLTAVFASAASSVLTEAATRTKLLRLP